MDFLGMRLAYPLVQFCEYRAWTRLPGNVPLFASVGKFTCELITDLAVKGLWAEEAVQGVKGS